MNEVCCVSQVQPRQPVTGPALPDKLGETLLLLSGLLTSGVTLGKSRLILASQMGSKERDCTKNHKVFELMWFYLSVLENSPEK